MKTCMFIVSATIALSSASGQIAGMTDPTGNLLIGRLLDGTAIAPAAVTRVHYVGMTSGGAQAGLLGSLTLRGGEGTSLTLGAGIVLSSGRIDNLPAANTASSYSNITGTGGHHYFRDFPAQTGSSRHGGRLDEHDENSITFDIDVPENIQGLTAQFIYASDEFPEWSGTQYADGFAFFVNDVNFARLPDGRPVSLLNANDNIHFMTNGDWLDTAVPTVADLEYDGLTRILELTAPLRAGARNTITIVVADTGDEIYDSAVFLSSLRFIEGIDPINPDDCSVHIRHSSDDDIFVEPASPKPCDGDLLVDGVVDDFDFVPFAAAYDLLVVPSADPAADFNKDGLVDDSDFVVFAAAYDNLLCP